MDLKLIRDVRASYDWLDATAAHIVLSLAAPSFWTVLTPERRLGKSVLLKKLAAHFVAEGFKVYVLTTSRRAFNNTFGGTGAIRLDDANPEVYANDKSQQRVFLVDDASHAMASVLNIFQRDALDLGAIYVETRDKTDGPYKASDILKTTLLEMPEFMRPQTEEDVDRRWKAMHAALYVDDVPDLVPTFDK